MNFRVTPVDGATVPSSAAHVSSVRTLVGPTATTRAPPPRAALGFPAAAGRTPPPRRALEFPARPAGEPARFGGVSAPLRPPRAEWGRGPAPPPSGPEEVE